MLGREVSTPLDIMYEMPHSIKSIPVHNWVWQLRERLESAHTYVRQNTGEAMKRQKNGHDRKVSYETFKPGNKVYVYFPVKKVGLSSKLTSFWKGPYTVIGKLSDVLYRLDCGRDHKVQIIHCDRMKLTKQQMLAHESPFEEHSVESDVFSEDEVSSQG